MPHAQRTNDVFWTSLNPNMAALLELYGQTLPGWSPLAANQCSQGPVQGGGSTTSVFSSQVFPIMFNLNGAVGGCAEWPNRWIRLLWEQI
jgi:hypothetical protein